MSDGVMMGVMVCDGVCKKRMISNVREMDLMYV